jgi:hypothetical protein
MAKLKAEPVSLPITLPCGCSTTLNLVHTGIKSHVAIITRKSQRHTCRQWSHSPAWQLHLFGYLTPAKFSRLDQLGIEFPQPPEKPCPESR